jgi:hypothetical protein
MGAGVAFRLAQFLSNRSFHLDEALFARNLCERSFAGLTRPLGLNQAAAVGFLWMVKASEAAFGCNEYALRLVPLVAGLLLLAMIYPLTRRLFGPRAAVLATAVVAVAPFLVYYSAEAKQYELDATFAAAVLLVGAWYAERPRSRWRLATLGGLGVAAIFCSHPAIFVLAGTGLWLLTVAPVREDARVRLGAALVAALWAATFVANYLAFMRPYSKNSMLNDYWQYAFVNFPPRGVADAWQYLSIVIGIFETLFGTHAPADATGQRVAMLAAALAAFGTLCAARENRRTLIPLLAPFGIAFLAAALHRYPVRDRLIAFSLPGFAILIARGLDELTPPPSSRARGFGAIAAACLLGLPLLYGVNSLLRPPVREEVRASLDYLAEHVEPGDAVFAHYEAQFIFDFYNGHRPGESPQPVETIVLKAPMVPPDEVIPLIDRALGRRAWLVLSHTHGVEEENEGAFLLGLFHDRGRLVDKVRFPGAVIYQFEMATGPREGVRGRPSGPQG